MPRAFPASAVQLAFALALAACSAATQRAYVAPTNQTVVMETEERQGNPPAHLIYVINRSTVPVRVFSVSLRNCENVKQDCAPKRVNHRVAPGGRVMALRVEPENLYQGFSYHFNFGWQADSSSAAALTALAEGGDARARERLAAIERADSIRKADPRPRYNELTRDDFVALAGRVASLRAEPESLTLAPGERSSIERLQVLLLNEDGQVLGRTQWLLWMVPGQGAIEFIPPRQLIARRPGRTVIEFRLADEAVQLLRSEPLDLELPVVVAYRVDPNAPVFDGRALDADSRSALACTRVALEDSLQNVVSSGRTDAGGAFRLLAPHPGTFRVRVETHGWVPSYGPPELASANERKEGEYLVRFTEQLLVSRSERWADSVEHAHPAAVTTEPIPMRSTGAKATVTPVVSGVTLGGSESMPILGIIGRVPAMTTWMQFVVDSTGRVDTTSILLPAKTPASAKASITSVLPRVRFSPAREGGTPTCELLRMQVNFSPR